MENTLRMNADFLLVRELADPPEASGLVRPYGRRSDEPIQAEVLLAGEGLLMTNVPPAHDWEGDDGSESFGTAVVYRVPMLAKVGDIVLLQFNAGTPVRVNGEVLRIVPDRDLFAVVVPALVEAEEGDA